MSIKANPQGFLNYYNLGEEDYWRSECESERSTFIVDSEVIEIL